MENSPHAYDCFPSNEAISMIYLAFQCVAQSVSALERMTENEQQPQEINLLVRRAGLSMLSSEAQKQQRLSIWLIGKVVTRVKRMRRAIHCMVRWVWRKVLAISEIDSGRNSSKRLLPRSAPIPDLTVEFIISPRGSSLLDPEPHGEMALHNTVTDTLREWAVGSLPVFLPRAIVPYRVAQS
jgi:hypothetical protein